MIFFRYQPKESRIAMNIRISFLILVFSIGTAIGSIPVVEDSPAQGGQSELASLAKKEAARREALDVKGPVITNIDLTRLLGNMKSQQEPSVISEIKPDEEGAPEEGIQAADDTEAREEMLDQLRDDLRSARQQVETLSNGYMVLELRINYLRNRLYQEADPFRLQALEKELSQSTADISTLRSEEAAARSDLERLMNEARAAGMLPGEINDIVGKIPVTQSTSTIE